MMKRRAALLLVCLLHVQGAQAFFDPPWITPASPLASEPVSVSIHGGGCDAIAERAGFPQVTQVGNAIRILEYGHHWDFQEFCIYDPATVTHRIGTFPPGEYTLTVDFIYNDGLPAPVVATIGVLAFTVSGQTVPAPTVPATTALGSSLLFILVLATGLLSARRHSHESGNPLAFDALGQRRKWIPAFAGMTRFGLARSRRRVNQKKGRHCAGLS
jgi:hypothetical protein